MKKNWILFILLLGLSSCVITSLHPLYSEQTTVFREDMLGDWQAEDGDVWHFTRDANGGKGYWLDIDDEDLNGPYSVHLVKLGDHYFLDLFPEVSDSLASQLPSLAMLLPTHNFMKIKFMDDGAMEIIPFDTEYLESLFKEKRIRIDYEETDEWGYILTASTEELQKFFVKYADDPKAFSDSILLHKQL